MCLPLIVRGKHDARFVVPPDDRTMNSLNRRRFLASATAAGASLAWANASAKPTQLAWKERRDLYPEGVASGDPHPDSVILWTRRPYPAGSPSALLTVELARDEEFKAVIATAPARVSAEVDWTCRVLVAGLRPRTTYWYRFVDAQGNGSRIGRTITAPGDRDARPVKFAFVSCQSVNEGAQHAYRRMIHEDRKAGDGERLGFVLHLGDFIYEVVQYPDEVKTRYDRTIFDIGKVPDARKVRNFHVPTTLEGYRFVYRAHLHDPDIQDARAYLPFVAMWDNHEFSWQGWQSNVKFDGKSEEKQPLKVAANQAWFEYHPAHIHKPSGLSLDRFDAPHVVEAPIHAVDDQGLGLEKNNLEAIHSLIAYRSFGYGRNVEMIITDQHSFMMEEQTGRPEAAPFALREFLDFYPQEVMEIIDAGRTFNGGHPPEVIRLNGIEAPNFRKDGAPFTILGATQKKWFLERLASSTATWKFWACSLGTLDWRADPQNLPDGFGPKWPSSGFAGFGGGDFGSAYAERGEIYDLIKREGITGFVTVAGDRHSFWAGYSAKTLPPKPFEPVGIAFVTGSISAPGLVEAVEHAIPKDHPLRPLYLVDRPEGGKPEATINMTMRHGVRSSIEYARSHDVEKARALSNPDVAPHLSFVDMGGHGYSTVRVTTKDILTEFVCIPRPIHRDTSEDGGPIRYRVIHRAPLWDKGKRPKLEQRVLEGDPKLSV
jgi:alkaline phosphatase D